MRQDQAGAMADGRIDVAEFIDHHGVGPFQWLVLALCFIVIALDGFDTAAAGFIAPAVVQDWGVPREALAPVFMSALFGLAVGALTTGPLADKYGRKIVIVLSVLCFGIFSLAASQADHIGSLIIWRFLTGLGLGAAMPNTITLMSEYSPRRRRSVLVTIMTCGFTLGAAGGGFVAAWLIPDHGWRSVLLVGGGAPLVMLPLLLWLLPESARFMVARNASPARIVAVLSRVARRPIPATQRFVAPADEVSRKGMALRTVLDTDHRAGTLLLWLTYFSGLLIVYLLTSWLPTLIRSTGFSIADAAIATAMFQLGGTAGAVLVGWGMDRSNPYRILAGSYLVAAVLILLIGRGAGSMLSLSLIVLAAGFFTSGAQTSMSALAAAFYPIQGRATGVSWMLGIGRFGAILGAFTGGLMLSAGLGFETIFALLAIPGVLCAVAVFAMGEIYRRTKPAVALIPIGEQTKAGQAW